MKSSIKTMKGRKRVEEKIGTMDKGKKQNTVTNIVNIIPTVLECLIPVYKSKARDYQIGSK